MKKHTLILIMLVLVVPLLFSCSNEYKAAKLDPHKFDKMQNYLAMLELYTAGDELVNIRFNFARDRATVFKLHGEDLDECLVDWCTLDLVFRGARKHIEAELKIRRDLYNLPESSHPSPEQIELLQMHGRYTHFFVDMLIDGYLMQEELSPGIRGILDTLNIMRDSLMVDRHIWLCTPCDSAALAEYDIK